MLAYTLWVVVYALFGNPESSIWCLMYYVLESVFIILFIHEFKKIYGVEKRIVNLLSFVFVLRAAFNVLAYVREDLGLLINNSLNAMIIVSFIIMICLIVIKAKR